MNPELESQAREVLAKVLAREDFPAVLVDPVSTYLVTGRAQNMLEEHVYTGISTSKYRAVFCLMYYLIRGMEHDVYFYIRGIRAHFKLYDS